MTPETDIFIPAVLPLKDRCSLNFHFWPPGPWDPCYFHLRESVFSLAPSLCLALPPPSLQLAESKRESNTQDCSYSINRSGLHCKNRSQDSPSTRAHSPALSTPNPEDVALFSLHLTSRTFPLHFTFKPSSSHLIWAPLLACPNSPSSLLLFNHPS